MQFWNAGGMGSLSGMMMGMGRGITSMSQLAALQTRFGIAEPLDNEAMESPELLGKGPKFPENSFERLRTMMSAHGAECDEFANQLQNRLGQMKEGFFESHSYQTMTDHTGKPRVALDEQGQPTLLQQPETSESRMARQEHETQSREALHQKQSIQKETFLQDEKQQVQTFLQNNRYELGNPAVQSELQKMLLETQKKGLKLQQEHDQALMKVDLPSEDMKLFADEETQKLRDMEKRQQEVQDSSQEARELLMYQQQVNELVKEEKKKLEFAEKDELFLKSPSDYLKPPPPPSLASVLPPYLTEALYNMGIYSID